ncbi:MAG TPA: response regulator, partial [Chitinophagaceae bacterium]|nr:response regulator [Chitinophagaceae bacterium]
MKIATLVIDDDVANRFIIRSYIEDHCPALLIAGEGGSVKEAIELIGKHKPDLLLLDISMPDGTAFDLLRAVPVKSFEVIFITAYDKYAIEAFKFSAIDYLLKPVAFTQLDDALRRVSERIEEKFFNRHWTSLAY